MGARFPPFPKTLGEFQDRFNTEDACLRYLEQVRWPDGFECPRCGHRRAWLLRRHVYRCRACRSEARVVAGTVLHRSHLSLRHWFWAAYLMSTLTPGISAWQLYRQLGLGSYRTALYLCRRLRRAMVNPNREPLVGVVEMDDTYVGGPERGRRGVTGRGVRTKIPIVVAVENRGDHAGRIRMQWLPELSWDLIRCFSAANLAPGSEVRTDAVSFYKYGDWGSLGLRHRPRVQGEPGRAGKILPWVHQVIGNLKTWLRGTHHGRMTRKHLQGYLDEFTFRFNRRGYREHSFLTLLVLATRLKPAWPLTLRRQVASSA